MSMEYIIILVDEPENEHNIDGQPAQVFMRQYEPPKEEFLMRIANENPGKRVYSLLGASTWYSV